MGEPSGDQMEKENEANLEGGVQIEIVDENGLQMDVNAEPTKKRGMESSSGNFRENRVTTQNVNHLLKRKMRMLREVELRPRKDTQVVRESLLGSCHRDQRNQVERTRLW